MPEPQKIAKIEEPWIEATILVPDEHLGAVLKLCEDRRGRQKNLTYAGSRAMLVYELPLNEVVFDFYDRLKSVSRGYASFDYHIIGYEEGELVKMALLVNDEPVDALSVIVHRCTRRGARPRHGREAEGSDPAASVQDPDPGRDRRQGDRAGDDQRAAQGRDRQMLWRRHYPQAQAAGQAEGGQEEDAELRQGRHPARGLHRRAQDGRELAPSARPCDSPPARQKRIAADPTTHGLRCPCFDAAEPKVNDHARCPHIFCQPSCSARLPGGAHAAPATIEGSWSGSGTAKLGNRIDRIVCRVSFARIEQKSYRVSSLCSMGDRRYEQSGRVSSVGGNRYTGWVFNEQFNERGSVALSQRGSRLSVTVNERPRDRQPHSVEGLGLRAQLSRMRQAR